jgi:hypothetical protein
MWERMMDASLLVVGAVALFMTFTVILFVYERREAAKNGSSKPLRVIRCVSRSACEYVGRGPGKSDRAA